MSAPNVLVVDDDPDIRSLLTDVFAQAGFNVETAADGRAALRGLFETRCDLVVLDLQLPVLDGRDVLARIRDMSDVRVLVLSALTSESGKLATLMAGADDYMTKPFSNAELVVRSLALLRRPTPHAGRAGVVDDGTVWMDEASRAVLVDGRPVSVTATDWNLLAAFVRHPGLVLSPQQLLDAGWPDGSALGTDRVKFAVMRLRRRLGWDDPDTSPIHSVRGFGYRYRPGVARRHSTGSS